MDSHLNFNSERRPSSSNEDIILKTRLCHLVKTTNYDGYGFNLHADRSRAGQFIGKVDEGSPAELSGLCEGCKIIEVDGVDISNESHKQVVQRIKAGQNETRLLVLDPPSAAADDHGSKTAEANGIASNRRNSSSNANGIGMLNEAKPTEPAERKSAKPNEHSLSDEQNSEVISVAKPQSQPLLQGDVDGINWENEDKASSDNNVVRKDFNQKDGGEGDMFNGDEKQKLQKKSDDVGERGGDGKGKGMNVNGRDSGDSMLDLNVSVQEMRARLAARKKPDPKKDQIDLRKKHEIIQTL